MGQRECRILRNRSFELGGRIVRASFFDRQHARYVALERPREIGRHTLDRFPADCRLNAALPSNERKSICNDPVRYFSESASLHVRAGTHVIAISSIHEAPRRRPILTGVLDRPHDEERRACFARDLDRLALLDLSTRRSKNTPLA